MSEQQTTESAERVDTRVNVDDYIEASPERVFDYVTDPERRPFGRDDFLTLGEEVGREEPSRVTWAVTVADGERERRGLVEVALTPEGPGTRIRVTHHIMATAPTLALAA